MLWLLLWLPLALWLGLVFALLAVVHEIWYLWPY